MSDFPDYSPKKGIFKPVNLKTLKKGLDVHIGKEFYFRYAWTIDEEDGGPYGGQIAYSIHLTEEYIVGERITPRLGWVPEEDIEWI